MWHVWWTWVMPTGFWWGDLMERDHLERPGIYGRIILRCIFRKWEGGAFTDLKWFRTGTGVGRS